MPITTRMVAIKWTRVVRRSSFSRPIFGHIRVSTMPMKKMTIGSVESATTEARATTGARVRAAR